MNPGKKTEPLALTLDQLIEEPRAEISGETSAPHESGEPVVTATNPIPGPVLEPEPSEMAPVPIPEEALENKDVEVNHEKPDCDTTPVEKINTRAGEEELPSESPPPPEGTGPETIPSTQNTDSGKAQRLITRLETFQKNAEKTFASKVIAPIKNEMALSLPASTNTENQPSKKPETKGDVSPTLTLEKLETFLFPTRQKN